MRRVQIEEGLWVRFRTRDASFAEGVEMGALAAAMAMAVPEFRRTISARSLEHARELAGRLGYRVLPIAEGPAGTIEVTFTTRNRKPDLRIVGSRA